MGSTKSLRFIRYESQPLFKKLETKFCVSPNYRPFGQKTPFSLSFTIRLISHFEFQSKLLLHVICLSRHLMALWVKWLLVWANKKPFFGPRPPRAQTKASNDMINNWENIYGVLQPFSKHREKMETIRECPPGHLDTVDFDDHLQQWNSHCHHYIFYYYLLLSLGVPFEHSISRSSFFSAIFPLQVFN